MLTIIAFLLTIIGSVNWLLIGLLQYDFVAGIFGFQASIFSRIIYIVIGVSSILLVFKLFKGKGVLAVFSRNNKKDLIKNIEKIRAPKSENAYANIEAGKDIESSPSYYSQKADFDDNKEHPQHKNMFDEHFDEN